MLNSVTVGNKRLHYTSDTLQDAVPNSVPGGVWLSLHQTQYQIQSSSRLCTRRIIRLSNRYRVAADSVPDASSDPES